MILKQLGEIKHLHILGPIIHIMPGCKKSDEERVEILKQSLKIIHEKFPIESSFCLIDFISQHDIRKQKWKQAELNRGIDLDFEVDKNDDYCEFDSDWEETESDEDEDEETRARVRKFNFAGRCH